MSDPSDLKERLERSRYIGWSSQIERQSFYDSLTREARDYIAKLEEAVEAVERLTRRLNGEGR